MRPRLYVGELDSFSVRGLVTAGGCIVLGAIALVMFIIRQTWGMGLGSIGFVAIGLALAYLSGVRVRRP
jgi:hypothetical protein